jgi:formate hydrogenlyase transcriptional activator
MIPKPKPLLDPIVSVTKVEGGNDWESLQARNVFSRPPPSWIDGTKEENAMASQPQAAAWLAVNGPKELEQLFRAIVFHPSAPILLADNDRRYREVSVGASKLLGLPREKIIGRSLDDFTAPSFRPVISELWRAFIEQGEQEGTLPLVRPDGGPRDVEYSAKGNVLPVRHLLVLRDKTIDQPSLGPVAMDKKPFKSSVPAWVQDYALFLLDVNGRVTAWYAGAERIYRYKSDEAVGRHVSLLYPDEGNLRVKLDENLKEGR